MLDWTTLPLPKLMVAPNGARKTKRDHPAIPLTVADVVADTASCHAAGANAVHFHDVIQMTGTCLTPVNIVKALPN